MGYVMFIQPVINLLFIGRANKMPIIAEKSDSTIKAIGPQRDAELFAQIFDRRLTNIVHGGNLGKGHTLFNVHLMKFFLRWINEQYAFTSSFPYCRALNVMPFQPMLNGCKANAVHFTYLSITAMLFMNEAYQFFFGRFLDATVKQSATGSPTRDIVELQPTKDFSLTHAKHLSNVTCSKSLSFIEAVNGFIIRAAMRCRGKGTLWQSLDAIPLEQMAYDRLINFKAFCNLLLSQSLSFIEVSKCFFIKLWSIVTLIRAIAGQGYCRGFAVKRFTATLANDRYKGRLTVSRSFGSSVGTIAIEQGKLNGVIQWGHSLLSLLLRFTGLGIDRVSSTVYAVSIFPHYTTSRANGLLFPVQIARVFQ